MMIMFVDEGDLQTAVVIARPGKKKKKKKKEKKKTAFLPGLIFREITLRLYKMETFFFFKHFPIVITKTSSNEKTRFTTFSK